MSEYWKSTPKYWCKHCKTFVKETKLEKTNHEASPRHQGNLQRFLRELHRGHEREARDKQRAKDEVARLNGVVPTPTVGGGRGAWGSTNIPPSQTATPADRKKQLQQLAEMGIAVPEDFRREMAMAGDWQTTSYRVIHDEDPQIARLKKEDNSEDKKGAALNIGVRKRKFEGQEEEEEEAGERVVRKGWGSTTRDYPGSVGDDDSLDALLRSTARSLPAEQPPSSETPVSPENATLGAPVAVKTTAEANVIKQEDSADTPVGARPEQSIPSEVPAMTEREKGSDGHAVVFKKRKRKPVISS